MKRFIASYPGGQRLARFSSGIYSISHSRRLHNFRGIRRRSRGVDRSRQMVLVAGLMSRNCLELAAWKSGAEWCTALCLQLFATMRCFELV